MASGPIFRGYRPPNRRRGWQGPAVIEMGSDPHHEGMGRTVASPLINETRRPCSSGARQERPTAREDGSRPRRLPPSTQSVGIVAVLAGSGARFPEGGGWKTVEAVGELVAGIRHADDDACDEPVAQLVLEEAESGEVI